MSYDGQSDDRGGAVGGLPRPTMLVAAALVAAVSGFYALTFRVNPDELGIVLRFGKFERQELPGLQSLRPWAIAYYIWGIRGYSNISGEYGVDNHIGYAARRAGKACGGVQLHVTDRDAFGPVRTGLAVVAAMPAVVPDLLGAGDVVGGEAEPARTDRCRGAEFRRHEHDPDGSQRDQNELSHVFLCA